MKLLEASMNILFQIPTVIPYYRIYFALKLQ